MQASVDCETSPFLAVLLNRGVVGFQLFLIRLQTHTHFRYGVTVDQLSPGCIYRWSQSQDLHVQREIADIGGVAIWTEGNTRRKEQASWLSAGAHSLKFSRARDDFAARIDNNDLISLVSNYPEIFMAVDGETICSYGTVDEDRRLARIPVGDWDFNNRTVAGVGYK